MAKAVLFIGGVYIVIQIIANLGGAWETIAKVLPVLVYFVATGMQMYHEFRLRSVPDRADFDRDPPPRSENPKE